MCNCAKDGALIFLNINNKYHERQRLLPGRDIEELVDIFFQNRRGEWPISLPLLNHLIDSILIFWRPGIRQYAPVTERPWTELRTALDPSNHTAARQQLRCFSAYVLRLLNSDKIFPLRYLAQYRL